MENPAGLQEITNQAVCGGAGGSGRGDWGRGDGESVGRGMPRRKRGGVGGKRE